MIKIYDGEVFAVRAWNNGVYELDEIVRGG
jgi:hypothetical protein